MMPTFEPVVLVDDRCTERLNWYSKFEKVLPDGTKLFTESQLQQAYEAGKRDAMPEWISVEKQLPVLHKGYSEDCLVITNFGNRLISRYDSYSKSWSLYQHEDHIVTLWMTLLAAPKGEKE